MDLELMELSSDNIGNYSEYLPEELVNGFDDGGYFGWGVLLGGDVAGAGVFKNDEEDIELVWLYIAEKARGLGIAGELLNRAEVTGELDGINSMSCTFLVPSQRDIMSFLQHMGFIVQERGAVPDEYNAPGMKEYIYIALKGEKYGDGEVTDYELMQMVPDAPFILPRFNELKAFFGENGYDAEEVIEEDELPYVSLGDNDNDIRFFIAPPEDDEPENFVIMARATVKVPKGKEKAVKDNFEKWQESCDVTSGFYDEEEGVLEYVAGLLAERQMPEKAMLVSFIETFLGDIKKLS